MLAWLVSEGEHPLGWLLFLASLGNVLGSLITWGMGYWVASRFPLRALNKPEHQRARRWVEHYGPLALLLAWLPIVGDPLCFAAGWLRVNLIASIITITLGKTIRYAVIVGLFS